jgi:hypothetical protein
MKKNQGISFFERYLTLWVAGCIAAGILIGQCIPYVPATLHQFEYANVSIPVAILIWLMIFPMMLKVDFNSVKNVGRRPKGILITGVTNWLIKPFTMFAIAWLFFFVVFKSLIPADHPGGFRPYRGAAARHWRDRHTLGYALPLGGAFRGSATAGRYAHTHLRGEKEGDRLFQQCLYPKIQQHHRRGVAAHPDHPLLLSG